MEMWQAFSISSKCTIDDRISVASSFQRCFSDCFYLRLPVFYIEVQGDRSDYTLKNLGQFLQISLTA